MIGYSKERRGYRIYDPENKQVIEERSVKFNETDLGKKFMEKCNHKEIYNYEYEGIMLDDETEKDTDRRETIDENRNTNENTDEDIGQNTEGSRIDSRDQGIDNEDVNISPVRGRPKGSTREAIELRDDLQRIEKQERDEQENLRRSKRIKERNQ
ncbi:hypothetical protein KPH14_013030, partial [Odynerus spinipes]